MLTVLKIFLLFRWIVSKNKRFRKKKKKKKKKKEKTVRVIERLYVLYGYAAMSALRVGNTRCENKASLPSFHPRPPSMHVHGRVTRSRCDHPIYRVTCDGTFRVSRLIRIQWIVNEKPTIVFRH